MRKTRQKRSMRRVKWLAGGLLAAALASLLLWRLAGTAAEPSAGVETTPAEQGIERVMILGVDRRSDDGGRSDTLMVASLQKQQAKGALLSIPRDTRVAIEGYGYDKINHAYAYGGQELSRRTVEQLIGVPVDHYILVDTKAFQRIIDLMDGVDLNVEKRMYYEDPWDDDGGLVIDLYPGEQHLDGERAIQYVRYRDGEGDIGRIARQQKFMRAVLAQALSPEILPRLPELAKEIFGAVETDMTAGELAQFASKLQSVRAQGLESELVPGKPIYLSDISYWMPDILALRKMVAEDMGIPLEGELLAAAEEAVKEYDAHMPQEIQTLASADGAAGRGDPAGDASDGKEIPGKKAPLERKIPEEAAIEKAKEATGNAEKAPPPEDDAQPMAPEEISVLVINSSGINGAGAEVAGVLQRKGFIISSVETGPTSTWEQTTITTSSRNTDVFYGMPFPCLIIPGGSKNQAVVHIGRDYGSQ